MAAPMNDRRTTAALPSVWTIALIGLATLFAIIAVRFAAQQSVWTDEATQLSGLTLAFADQLRWLAGRLPQAFAVPPDRMPPLSYWLGSIWTQPFGYGVLTARYLSVCLSVASVFVLWAVARQYLERRTALICAALLALSPNFVVEAAEIRAYAAFIFFSTLLIYAYLRLLAARPTPSSLDLWAFALVATLCSYTHFFGIVISAGAFLCLCASYLPVNSRTEGLAIVQKAKWPLLVNLISVVALIPFVLSAVKISGGGDVSTAAMTLPFSVRIHDFIKLIYRLFSHQSMLGIPGLSAAALLAGLTLMVFATIPGSNQRARQLLLFLLVNLALVALIGLTTSAFHAFAPSYNVWALPVTALLAATALAHRNRVICIASTLCISVIIAADCYAALRLSTAGEVYGHTRSTVVKSAVDSAGPRNVIVLYVNDAPSIYFALTYDYGGALRQYIAGGNTVHLVGLPVGSPSVRLCDLNAGTLLVAGDQQLSAEALQFLIANPGVHTQAYHALDEFLETHHADIATNWTLVSRNEYLAQSALALAVFKGHTADVSSSSANCNAR
jgi:4-amino-4-deoxy-L-arabinose transferase-like glycosyltransferase